MVFSATGTVRRTWPAAENFSVLRPLLHRHPGLLRALPATHRTGSVAMSAVQQRSDAADRRSLGECRNRRMGQLMSNAISYARAGRGFPFAQVCAELCLDPVSAAPGVSLSLRTCCFLGFTHSKTHPAGSLSSIPSILSRLPFQYRDLPKHIACGMLQRLSTTEF